MSMYDVILNKVHELGYVPSIGTMARILSQDNKCISKSGVRYWYNILTEEGIFIDTGEIPKWILAYCPSCGEYIPQG